jgi:alkanesulfonate monooxygenase SsuD/methylene tetrahydromethanopterin reductase-like flavin-dependent oxidoreductase (luciferase family)
VQIGIGLPSAISWTSPSLTVEWAKKAEERSFASLGLVDRIVYPNYESLVSLAVAAGATRRIGLVTTVLLAPLRNTTMLAKQAASLDNLSGGRLTLGLGIGSREDDFRATDQPFKDRGRRFDEQLQQLKRIWAGQPLSDDVGPIGPTPVRTGGPEILIGGRAPAAMERVARWGNGYIAGSAPPEQARRGYEAAERAWQAAGRPGKPRFVAAMYYALGADAAERGARYIRDYYAFVGPMVEGLARSLPSTPDAVKAAFEAYLAVGADEVIAWPTIAELDQVELLADVVAKSAIG